MTLFRPLFMQAAEGDTEFEYSANEFRNFWGLLFNAEGVANTNGATNFANNDLKVRQRSAGANMSVEVLGGLAVILGEDVTFQGFYVAFSSATENLVIPSPPVSGTRIHRVVARVRDKLHDGTQTTYDWVLEVLEDDDGSGPPDTPDSAISLATVTVDFDDTSVLDAAITDTRGSAVMGSGMTAGRNVGSDAGRPANPHDSEIIWRTDKDDYEVWDGSGWRRVGLSRPYAILTTNTNQNISNTTTTAVNFATEIADSHGGHDNSTNNTRYTAPQAGVYHVSAQIPFVNNVGEGKYELGFRVNGGSAKGAGTVYKGTQNVTPIVSGSRLLQLNQGDYVEALVWHGTGTTRAIDASFNGGPSMDILWERSL